MADFKNIDKVDRCAIALSCEHVFETFGGDRFCFDSCTDNSRPPLRGGDWTFTVVQSGKVAPLLGNLRNSEKCDKNNNLTNKYLLTLH